MIDASSDARWTRWFRIDARLNVVSIAAANSFGGLVDYAISAHALADFSRGCRLPWSLYILWLSSVSAFAG
jgi:hypothetical protein